MTIGWMKRLVLATIVLVFAAPRAFAASPSCSTFDDGNRPTSNFAAGEKIIVRGTGFSPNALVLITFQQGTSTAEVAKLKTNDLGAFATDPSSTRLPSSLDRGAATIQVLQGSGAASCNIRLLSADASHPGGFGRTFYLTWGVLLILCAMGLIFATVRRWQADRLAAEMDAIAWDKPPSDDDVVVSMQHPIDDEIDDEIADAPLEIVELDPLEDEYRPLLEDDEDDVIEEPVLSGTSDAVARLQREVRSWRTR